MDPNANLKEQREYVVEIREVLDACEDGGEYTFEQAMALGILADGLQERVKALDEWITKGGFLPIEWNHRGAK